MSRSSIKYPYVSKELLDSSLSPGLLSGNGLSDNGDGTVAVAEARIAIRATDDDTASIKLYTISAVSSLSLTDNDVNYIYVEYNSGSPQVVATVTERTDYNTNVLLGSVYREGTDLHINGEGEAYIASGIRRLVYRLHETHPFERASGGIISETGTRNVGVSAGVFWEGLTRFTTAAVDTSAGDTFVYVYRDGLGGFTEVASQTQIDNTQYDDGDGTLATLTANAYGVHWVYLENDGDVYILYGQDNYNNIGQAQDANPPGSLPEHMADHARLLGKIIIRNGEASFTEIQSAFDVDFAAAPVADHGDLSGLTDDDHPQYFRLDQTSNQSLSNVPTATISTSDKVLILDADASDLVKTVTTQDIADLAGGDFWVHADPSTATGLSTFTLPTESGSVFIAPETDAWDGTAAGSGITNSVMIGYNINSATGSSSNVTIGNNAQAGLRSIAIGYGVTTSSDAVIIGYLAAGASDAKCTLIGGTLAGSQPIGETDAVGVGAQVRPSRYAVAFGTQAGSGWYSVAMGNQADAGNSYVWERNVAIGYQAKCRGARRIAIGAQCEATADRAYSFGYDHINSTSDTFAIGYTSTTWGVIGSTYWRIPINGNPMQFGANNYGEISRDNNVFLIEADANDILKLLSPGGALFDSSHTTFKNTEEFIINNPSSQTTINSKTYISGVSTTGSDLVTNGDFASGSTGWSVSGFTISGAQAYVSGVSSSNTLQQTIFVTAGKWYKVTFTVGDYSNSPEFDLTFSFAGYTAPVLNTFGTYEFYFQATTGGGVVNFQFSLDVLTSGGVSIDDISLFELNNDGFLHVAGDAEVLGDISVGQRSKTNVTTVTTTSHTAGDEHVILVDDDTAGSAVTVTLPAASGNDGLEYRIKKIGSTANVVIDGNGSETIDGATTATLTAQYESIDIVCNGTSWFVL